MFVRYVFDEVPLCVFHVMKHESDAFDVFLLLFFLFLFFVFVFLYFLLLLLLFYFGLSWVSSYLLFALFVKPFI